MPAVSAAQQRFFGMIRATQKGTLKNPPPRIAKAAKGISAQDAHDFAATKHEGLPEKVAMLQLQRQEVPVGMPYNHDLHQLLSRIYPLDPKKQVAHTPEDIAAVRGHLGWNHDPDDLDMVEALLEQEDGQPHMGELKNHKMAVAFGQKFAMDGAIAEPETAEDSDDEEATTPGTAGLANPIEMSGESFGTKLAYVELPPSKSRTQGSANIKPQPLVSPVAMQQQQAPPPVIKAAPNVPNPIVPQHQQIPLDTGMKTACTKMAPRYTSKGKKGKKTMPEPYARRTKAACFNSVGFAASLAGTITREKKALNFPNGDMTNPVADPGETFGPSNSPATAFGRNLGDMADMTAGLLGNRAAHGLGGIGTTVGAAGGAYSAPGGHKMEGVGRGVGQGLGWDVGGIGGAVAGGALGGMAGKAVGPMLGASPEVGNIGGQLLGGIGGYLGGGMLGSHAAAGMMGKPTWDKEDEDPDMMAAKMSA